MKYGKILAGKTTSQTIAAVLVFAVAAILLGAGGANASSPLPGATGGGATVGGGATTGNGTDTNPNNPLNWHVTVAMTTPRVDRVDRYEYNWLNQVEHAVYVRTWTGGGWAPWYRNGVNMGFADFAVPIVDVVRAGQFSDYTAGWTVTVEWIGVGAAPASAPIVVNSPDAVWHSFGGSGYVSNGVGGHEFTTIDELGGFTGNKTYIVDPMVVRVVSINPQTKIGTLQFNTEAHTANPAGQTDGFIWTDFGTPATWFDVRTAFVYGYASQIPYNRNVTGNMLTATIYLTQDGMPMPVTNEAFHFFDEEDHAYNPGGKPRVWQYSEALPQQAEILYGPNYTNYSSWQLGITITPQSRFTLIPDGVSWREPDPVQFFAPFNFAISPTGNMLGSWTLTGRTNASGGNNDLINGWYSWEDLLIPPVSLKQYIVYNSFGEQHQDLQSVHYEANEEDASYTIVLDAAFTDGVHATSIRDVQYHPSLEDITASPTHWVDFQVNQPYQSVPIGPSSGGGFYPDGIVPPDTATALLYPKDFPYWNFYIDDALEATLMVVSLIPFSPELPVVIRGLLATGMDLAGANIPDTDIPDVATHIDRDNMFKSDICDTIYVQGFGFASWTEILNGQVRGHNSAPMDGYPPFMHPAYWKIEQAKWYLRTVLSPTWSWSARFRPASERWLVLRDKWGIGGFESRRVDEKSQPMKVGSDQLGFFYMSYAPISTGVQFPPS